MRGKYSRRKIYFKTGRVPPNKGQSTSTLAGDAVRSKLLPVCPPTKRLTPKEFNMVTRPSFDGESIVAPDVDGSSGSMMLLRPKVLKEEKQENINTIDGNRIIDVQLMVEMFNSIIKEHAEQPHMCMIPRFELKSEKKWALGWTCSLKCSECGFQSRHYKLYREATSSRPGPKPALVNQYLQSALLGQGMGNKGARIMLNHLNLPTGCKSAMQRQSNTISTAVTSLNKKDMEEKANLVVHTNQLRGTENPNIIGISVDGRYNSNTFGSAKKPGQNASQGLSLGIETCTQNKWIIARVLQNKLCWTGAWLRGKGFEVKCPGDHEGCTANLHPNAVMSEYEMGKDIGTQLALQGLLVKYATTDGDGTSAMGIQNAIKALHPMWKVERLADPTHLAKSQFRQCNSAKFSLNMFPGKTKQIKTNQQKTLAQDIKARCSLIFKELMKKYNGDMTSITKCLPSVVKTTLACYSGDCSGCKQHSLVCNGGESSNWWLRSVFLGTSSLHDLNMTTNDEKLMIELLKLRLRGCDVHEA